MPSALSASSTGAIRAISVSDETGAASGLLDAGPRSITSAPLGHQLTRLRNGCVWRQIPASIGETVRGYVDDAENDERFIHGGFYNNLCTRQK